MSRHRALPLIAAAASWGFGAVASKHAIEAIAPTSLLVVQLLSSIAALAIVRRLSHHPARRRPALRLAALGVLNPGVAYLLSLAGLARITAGLSVLVWSLEPVAIAILAGLVFRIRITLRMAALMGAAVAGAALAGAAGVGDVDGAGLILTAAAVSCCAVYTIAASSWFGGESNLDVVVGQQWFALGLAAVVFALTGPMEAMDELARVGTGEWVSAIGSGFLYYGVAFWAYLTGLRESGPAVAAVYLNLIPLFGIAGGWVFLGEQVSGLQAAGAAVVMAAVSGLTLIPAESVHTHRGE